MAPEAELPRRTVLVAGTVGGAAALLAACSSGGASSAGSEPTSAGSTGGAPTAAPVPAEPSGPSSAAPASSGAAGHALATLTDIPVGRSVSVKLPGGEPGLLSRTSPTAVVCFNATCPHEGCTVAPDGARFTCPCHRSQFDPATGAVLGGPAPGPLTKVAVTVTGGKVVAT